MALTQVPIELSSTPGIVDNSNTTELTIDSSGNVGIGQGPTAFTNWKVLELKGGTAGAMLNFENSASTRVSTVAYDDGGDKLRIQNFLANPITFETNNIERMRIDSTGNVGIGTSSIDFQATNRTVVHVEGSAGALLALEDTGAKGYFFQSGNDLLIENDTSTGSMIFGTNSSTERMRIDSSGNVLVGKTSQNLATEGISINPLGYIQVTESQSPALYLNRLSTDGTIINFYKDGSTVGNIGTNSGNIYLSDGARSLIVDGDTVKAGYSTGGNADGAQDLGNSSVRWRNLYLSGTAFVDGNVRVAAGNGILLGGTATENKLDDYEEGTWTPAYTTSNSNATVAYQTQRGKYTKIGNLVFITWYVEFGTVTSAGTGSVKITGVPFQAETANDSRGQDAFYSINWDSANYNHPVSYLPSSSSSAVQFLMTRDNGTWTVATTSTLTVATNNVISGSMVFRV